MKFTSYPEMRCFHILVAVVFSLATTCNSCNRKESAKIVCDVQWNPDRIKILRVDKIITDKPFVSGRRVSVICLDGDFKKIDGGESGVHWCRRTANEAEAFLNSRLGESTSASEFREMVIRHLGLPFYTMQENETSQVIAISATGKTLVWFDYSE